jgi:hypothetical protein
VPILACAEEYAKLLGAKRVVIKDAVDPAVYARYGYDMVRLPQSGGVPSCEGAIAMAIKNGTESLVKTDDFFASAVSAAMARIEEVGPTTTLIETLVKQGWRDWDDSGANIVVSDSSEIDALCFDEDEQVLVPHAA